MGTARTEQYIRKLLGVYPSEHQQKCAGLERGWAVSEEAPQVLINVCKNKRLVVREKHLQRCGTRVYYVRAKQDNRLILWFSFTDANLVDLVVVDRHAGLCGGFRELKSMGSLQIEMSITDFFKAQV